MNLSDVASENITSSLGYGRVESLTYQMRGIAQTNPKNPTIELKTGLRNLTEELRNSSQDSMIIECNTPQSS